MLPCLTTEAMCPVFRCSRLPCSRSRQVRRGTGRGADDTALGMSRGTRSARIRQILSIYSDLPLQPVDSLESAAEDPLAFRLAECLDQQVPPDGLPIEVRQLLQRPHEPVAQHVPEHRL